MLPFTLQQLRILKAIATEKSFTRAAEVLYLSQPSLSKQIKTLEKKLNKEPSAQHSPDSSENRSVAQVVTYGGKPQLTKGNRCRCS